jgi:RNA-directed DNA polymerase
MSEVFNFEKLYSAYLNCRKEKRRTINALKFEFNLEENLFVLLEKLKLRKYRPGKSICFVVTDPVAREIFAAEFKDRIIHHLLVKEIEIFGERKFIFNSFSCRKGKGTHLAVNRLKKSIREHYKKKIYYLQMDIAGFFMAIDKKILYTILEKLVLVQNKSKQWKKDILWLSSVIIFHKPTENYVKKGDSSLFNLVPFRKSLFNSKENKGLPIGNYSSQFFANLYLNQLDHFIKRNLKCKNYFRYVDDFILLSNDKEKLKLWHDEIEFFLKKHLKLEVSHKKTKIKSVERGIDFLGYFIRPDYMLARKRVVGSFKKKIFRARKENDKQKIEIKKIIATINSYLGHFYHANTFNLRKKICFFSKKNFDLSYGKDFGKVVKKI